MTGKIIDTKILSNKVVGKDIMRMVLDVSNKSFGALPGQFIMVKASEEGTSDPILRRPFGVLRYSGTVEILYKIVGRGTKWMAGMSAGNSINIMGPLGNGFNLDFLQGKKVVLAAGGIGIAPLFALAEYLSTEKNKVSLLYGARDKDELALLESVKAMGVSVKTATEDGSHGSKGFVTKFLGAALDEGTVVVTCGPFAMMKEVNRIAKENGCSCYASLDCRMACGFGVCTGCVVKVQSPDEGFAYKRVCKEGPVFNGDELLWE